MRKPIDMQVKTVATPESEPLGAVFVSASVSLKALGSKDQEPIKSQQSQ